MREWWANIYRRPGGGGVFVTETQHATRDQARRFSTSQRIGCVHVRLKPEGAPRRYASTWERWGWENMPETMREMRCFRISAESIRPD